MPLTPVGLSSPSPNARHAKLSRREANNNNLRKILVGRSLFDIKQRGQFTNCFTQSTEKYRISIFCCQVVGEPEIMSIWSRSPSQLANSKVKTMLFALLVGSIATVLTATQQESEVQRARRVLESS